MLMSWSRKDPKLVARAGARIGAGIKFWLRLRLHALALGKKSVFFPENHENSTFSDKSLSASTYKLWSEPKLFESRSRN
jgi:hypothetical protein